MNTQELKPMKIHTAICAIMAEVGGVAKTRSNEAQHYKFRGIADIYLACQPVMAKHGVHVVPVEIVASETREGTSKNGGVSYHVIQRTRFHAYADDGSFVQIEAMGEAIDSSDKASNKAMSAAMKYALVQLFALPEEDPDIDTESASPEVKADSKPPQNATPKPAEKKPSPLKHLVSVLKLVGKEKPADVLGWMTSQLKKDVEATKDLTEAEIATLTESANAILKETT